MWHVPEHSVSLFMALMSHCQKIGYNEQFHTQKVSRLVYAKVFVVHNIVTLFVIHNVVHMSFIMSENCDFFSKPFSGNFYDFFQAIVNDINDTVLLKIHPL